MSSFELNKIFAAILVAGITAMLAGFIAEQLTHPHELEKDAVAIEGGAAEGGGAASAAAMPEPVLHLIATADAAQGEKLSKACASCHSFGQGEAAKTGPNLWGIIGAKKGHMSGFTYSDQLLAKGGNWSYSDLNHFLWSPKKYIPGTKMGYIGMKKPEDRAAILAWLRTLGGAGLPSQAEIDAEAKELAPPAPAGEVQTPAATEGTPELVPSQDNKPAEAPVH
ncbi:MAG: cytochrome c family protein [Alphaproteobacteria bacterium]|nr:cytochrome c family protein [Alphaproteobacteria bacterium]